MEGELPDPWLVDPTAAATARVVNALSTTWTSTTDYTRWMGRGAVSTTQE
jgi:hypothetical protein